MTNKIACAAALLSLVFSAAAASAADTTNYHLVGWTNVFLPGSGRLMLGEPLHALEESTLTVGSLAWGYSISNPGTFAIDGVPNALPEYGSHSPRGATQVNLIRPMYSEMLQEVGIKTHMTFIFLSYREAAKQQGITDHIDQSPVNEMFLSPFRIKYLSDPWVWLPMVAVAGATVLDYISSKDNLPVMPRLSQYSNFLYAMDYQVVRPIGSGVPEEALYRGFLQNELRSVVDSPFFTIPLEATAFAFSHGPGPGRYSAGLAGAYLGFLANHFDGLLGPGITLHFWSELFLGIETVFLSHDSQHTTPPTALQVQISY